MNNKQNILTRKALHGSKTQILDIVQRQTTSA